MGKDAVVRKTQQAGGQTPVDEIARFYSVVSASGFQPRLRYVSGICEFDITGAGIWRINIKEGVPTVTQGAVSTPQADCVVTCSAEDFLRVIHRENHINVMAAVLQGLISVTGDVGFATMVLGSAVLEPPGQASVEMQA